MNSGPQVLTFVFTDIEGSTRLLRRLHDDYARVLAEHHALLDECFEGEGGKRLATEGDGGFFVFESPAGAVHAAVAAQEAMQRHPWPADAPVRVRIGMHTGEATAIGPASFVGLAVHLAARISALGRGGQTLVSDTTRVLAGEGVADIPFHDLGDQELADFPEPVRIYQVGAGSGGAPATLQALPETPLPAVLGSLHGREAEIAAVVATVGVHRLVTVTGPGGTGKTRLVVETSRRLRSEGRTVVFVDLTGVTLPERIPAHVAGALGFAQDPDVSPIRQIGSSLGRRKGVLVLDNCEHLTPAIADFVVAVLGASDDVAVLATSRVPLGVTGEHLFHLEPLEVGAPGEAGPAIQLFIARAGDVAPDFVADEESLPVIRRIVRRLDGLPLAIELAASMARLLSTDELERMLAERLDVLEGGPTRPDRHRSLAAALRWNVDALPEGARQSFDRLGVMTGPFFLDDLGVTVDKGPLDALQLAGLLIDHSLLVRTRVAGKASFRMLETIRWFAVENLQEAGELADAKRRHLAHFVNVARASRETMRGPGVFRFLPQLWPRRPNLLAALDYALETNQLESAIELVEGLVEPWAVRSAAREARLATARVMAAAAGADPALELRAGLARMEMWQADGVGIAPERELTERVSELAATAGTEADRVRIRIWQMRAGMRLFEDHRLLVEQLEGAEDWRSTAYGLETLGWMLWWKDQYPEGNDVFRRLYDSAAERQDSIAMLDATAGFAATSHGLELLAEARKLAQEASEIATRLDCAWWEALNLQWEASHSRRLGHLDESAEWLQRAYRLAVERGTLNQLAFVTANQATLAWFQGDVDRAYAKTREFAEADRQAADSPYNPFVLEMASAVAMAWGLTREGAMLCGAAEQWRRPGGLTEQGTPMPGWDVDRHDEVKVGLRKALGDGGFTLAVEEGRQLSRDDAMSLALRLSPNGG